jgi:hypothetical protein
MSDCWGKPKIVWQVSLHGEKKTQTKEENTGYMEVEAGLQ